MSPTVPTSPALVGLAEFLDRDDAFGGARQRIAPQRHRHRAGMAGHTGEARRQPRGARDRRHHADGKVFLLQNRPLLDVQFDIGKQLAAGARGSADTIGIEPELLSAPRASRGRRGRATFSTPSSKVPATARLPSSVEANRTPSSSAKPMTSTANGSRLPAPVQVGDAGNRRDHAERPVPFAGVAHGVVMRAQHQARQARALALVTAADIADGVEMRGHAGIAHPRQEQIGRGAMLG